MRRDENEILLKVKPLYRSAYASDNLSPDVQNFKKEGLAFSNSLTFRFFFFFFGLSGGWSHTNGGAIPYLYVSFC